MRGGKFGKGGKRRGTKKKTIKTGVALKGLSGKGGGSLGLESGRGVQGKIKQPERVGLEKREKKGGGEVGGGEIFRRGKVKRPPERQNLYVCAGGQKRDRSLGGAGG